MNTDIRAGLIGDEPCGADLAARIHHHLRAGGRVMIATYTRRTIYDHRHVDWFSGNQRERGVRVRSGRKSLYVFPEQLVFSKDAQS